MTEDKIIEDNYGLVVSRVNTFYRPNPLYSFEDLMQVGFIGLIHASRKFNPSICQFSTFATMCINQHLIKFTRRNSKKTYDSKESRPASETEPELSIGDYYPDSLSDLEISILNYRLEGYKNSEIRQILDLTRIKYNKILKSIRFRIEGANA
jgi:RNA polymerase sigma factor (sigma-70 family)